MNEQQHAPQSSSNFSAPLTMAKALRILAEVVSDKDVAKPAIIDAADFIDELQAVKAQMLEALKVAISYHVRTYQEGQDDDEMIVYMALHAAIAAAEGREG